MLKVTFAALALICYILGLVTFALTTTTPTAAMYVTGISLIVAALAFTLGFVLKETELPA